MRPHHWRRGFFQGSPGVRPASFQVDLPLLVRNEMTHRYQYVQTEMLTGLFLNYRASQIQDDPVFGNLFCQDRLAATKRPPGPGCDENIGTRIDLQSPVDILTGKL